MATAVGIGNNKTKEKRILYYSPISFYSQKVLLALYEKKLKFEHNIVDLRGEQYQPWYMELNPKGEVPVLKDRNKIIPDSSKIIEYLEENYTDDEHHRLLPEKDTEVAKKEKKFRELLDPFPSSVLTFGCLKFPELTVNMRMGFAERKIRLNVYSLLEEILDRNVIKYPEFKAHYVEKKEAIQSIVAKFQDKDNVNKALDDVEKILTSIEEELSSHKDDKELWWLCNENFTWADILLTIVLHRLCFLGLWEKYFVDGKNPCLAEYFKRVQKRDSFKKVFGKCPMLLQLMHSDVTTKGLIAATGVAIVIGVAATGALLYHKLKKA